MSFFRTFIHKETQEELFNRIDASNYNQNAEDILSPKNQKAIQGEYLRSCWARAAVVIGDEGTEQVRVLNSLYDYENKQEINEPLNIKDGQPFRGRPGITSITSTFKEFFMKQSTISFYVPDPKEFDTFKDEFLKFGRYILLEWGWVTPQNLTLDKLSGNTILKMSKNIQKRIKKGKGNYTANVGVVTNYNFNQTKEGAYEGTIEISSMGRNILEQQHTSDGHVDNIVGHINDILNEKELDKETLNESEKENFEKIQKTFLNFNSTMEELDFVVKEYLDSQGTEGQSKKLISGQKLKDLKDKFDKKFLFGLWTNNIAATRAANMRYQYHNGAFFADNEFPLLESIEAVQKNVAFGAYSLYKRLEDYINKGKDEENDLCFVTWGWFEDFILNSFFSFTSTSTDFKTEFRSVKNLYDNENSDEITGYKNLECKSHPDLYSLGLQSVILPGKTEEYDIESTFEKEKTDMNENKVRAIAIKLFMDKVNEKFPNFETEAGKRGSVRNMVFSTKYLKESFIGTQSIEKSLTSFWQKVSNDYGGFWRFSVNEDENADGKVIITDLNLGVEDDSRILERKLISTKDNPDQVFKFPVYSQNSIVTDMQLQSSNDSEMATMAVFGSNTSLETTGADMGKGFTANAMRALAAFDGVSKSVKTPKGETKKQYVDKILNNISNPIYGNFQEQKASVGSSAIYDKEDGKITKLDIKGGIDFSNVKEIAITRKSVNRHITNNTNEESGVDVSAESLASAYYWFTPGKEIQIYGALDGHIYQEFKRTMLYKINKSEDESSVFSSVLPIVPLQVSLTLKGIGGIKVGDLFYINYLPEKYRKYCHFMVVNVEHTIDTSGWTTKLDSRMIVDIPKMIDNGEIKKGKILRPINVLVSLQRTKAELKRLYGDEPISSFEPNTTRINSGGYTSQGLKVLG
jgi:hypothetical protein